MSGASGSGAGGNGSGGGSPTTEFSAGQDGRLTIVRRGGAQKSDPSLAAPVGLSAARAPSPPLGIPAMTPGVAMPPPAPLVPPPSPARADNYARASEKTPAPAPAAAPAREPTRETPREAARELARDTPREATREPRPQPAADLHEEPIAIESSATITRLPALSESLETLAVPDLPPPPADSSGSETMLAPSSAPAPIPAPAPSAGPRPDAQPPEIRPVSRPISSPSLGADTTTAAPSKSPPPEDAGEVPKGGFPNPPSVDEEEGGTAHATAPPSSAAVAARAIEQAPAPAPADAAGSERDIMFGELARLQRFITEAQLTEALRISKRLRDEKRPKKLGKIMVKLGFLSATQAKYLLRLQRTPDPIEGYKLLERRGQGGMGVVYRAVQKSLKREVAVKILAPKWAQQTRFLKRFMREAKLAGTLNHPNIVSAIDVGESGGLHYYAMEYVDGWSVAEMLKEDGPFEELEALDVVTQVAQGLEHAAEHHIVHRDVKPENILVTPDSVAKLADLGLSKQLTSDCTITTEGKTLGTPFYVSPELARGLKDIDERSDIYSLGATLWHMLVGEPPFTGENPAAVMARHIAEEPVPVRKRRRDISAATSKLVEKMMQKNPDNRYDTAAALIEDIASIKKGKNPFAPAPRSDGAESGSMRAVGGRPRRSTMPPERPGGRETPRGPMIAALIAVAIGAVALAIMIGVYTNKTPEPEHHAATPEAQAPVKPPTLPPSANIERESAARMRFQLSEPDVRERLQKGRYDDARSTADDLLRDAAGTSVEPAARALLDEVRQAANLAVQTTIRKARHELDSGHPTVALELLRSTPETDVAELQAEVQRARDEASKAARTAGP